MLPPRSYLDSPVQDYQEKALQDLVDEMLHVAGLENSHRQNFIPFLILCQHPNGGSTKRIPFRRERCYPGYLDTSIERTESPVIQRLCQELAGKLYEPLEMHINKKLMTFLNYVVLNLERASSRARRRR